jgi:hypothetical protein
MGAVAPVLAIANIVVMVGLSLSSYPLDEVLHYVRFEPAGPALALFGVILIVALVLSFIPQTRGAGLGMLLSMGGFLAMDWTSISVTFYSKSGTGFEVYQLQGGQVAAALICLGLALALCATAGLGLYFESPSGPPGGKPSRASVLFGMAASGALAWVLLLDLYPLQFSFQSFAPLGILLDLIGIVAVVAPFALLAGIPGFRPPAVGATVAWIVVALVLFMDSVNRGFTLSLFTEFAYRWRLDLPFFAIVVVAIVGTVGITQRGMTPRAHPGTILPGNRHCASGHGMAPFARFCPQCGAPPIVPGVAGSPVCPNGHLIPSGDTFCSDCGLPASTGAYS